MYCAGWSTLRFQLSYGTCWDSHCLSAWPNTNSYHENEMGEITYLFSDLFHLYPTCLHNGHPKDLILFSSTLYLWASWRKGVTNLIIIIFPPCFLMKISEYNYNFNSWVWKWYMFAQQREMIQSRFFLKKKNWTCINTLILLMKKQLSQITPVEFSDSLSAKSP